MTYQTQSAGFSPKVFTVHEETDSRDGYLSVETLSGELIYEIAFDLFVEERFRKALADNFAQYSFLHPRDLLLELGRPKGSLPLETNGKFTLDEAIFADKLVAYGVPLHIAVRTAFYSVPYASAREAALSHYMTRGVGVRLLNSGTLQGFTTIDLYLYAFHYYGVIISDSLSGNSLGEPQAMASQLEVFGKIAADGIALEQCTIQQLSLLTAVAFTEREGDSSVAKKNAIMNRALARFIAGGVKSDLAAKLLRSSGELKDKLVEEISSIFLAGDQNFQLESEARVKANALASVCLASCDEELMGSILKLYKANRPLFNPGSPYLLSVFLAFATHFKEGGDSETPVHFILALDPEINDSEVFTL